MSFVVGPYLRQFGQDTSYSRAVSTMERWIIWPGRRNSSRPSKPRSSTRFVVTHPANLRYLCGYTGSNGLLLFMAGRKLFFTDGRYTVQARDEVKGARLVISKGALVKDAAALLSMLNSALAGFEGDLTTVAEAAQLRGLTHKRIQWKPTAGLVMRQRSDQR